MKIKNLKIDFFNFLRFVYSYMSSFLLLFSVLYYQVYFSLLCFREHYKQYWWDYQQNKSAGTGLFLIRSLLESCTRRYETKSEVQERKKNEEKDMVMIKSLKVYDKKLWLTSIECPIGKKIKSSKNCNYIRQNYPRPFSMFLNLPLSAAIINIFFDLWALKIETL